MLNRCKKLIVCTLKTSDSKFSTRRAVSDIITTLLLMAITVIGGVVIWGTLSGGEVANNLTTSVQQPTVGTVKIIGYDTRDGDNLSGISSIDNNKNNLLEAGVDFIVVEIRNASPSDAYWIEKILINSEEHLWDGDTSQSDVGSSPPVQGKFSITTLDSTAKKPNNQVMTENQARLIIRLSSNLDSIDLGKSIRIDILGPNEELKSFVIQAGLTK